MRPEAVEGRRRLRRKALFAASAILAPLLAQTAPGAAWAQGAPEPEEVEVESIVVEATRSGRQVQDEPIRVEVVARDEIDEKISMAPGNVAMLVNETSGVRLQTTSPAMGAARIRVQGLGGRYTQLLADGLPLYGGQASPVSLLQIPPTDLGQVEVIKGAASALYGPSALGGIINLVSRRPGEVAAGDLLLNATSRDGQDFSAYGETPLGQGWRGSLIGGLHRQGQQDLDDDGWLDIPGYERWTLRPRLFWTGDGGAKVFATLGAMQEERTGGTEVGATTPDGRPFRQTQDSERWDGGLVIGTPLTDRLTAHVRASAMRQADDKRFGDGLQDDRQSTVFAEASLAANTETTSLLAGMAYQVDRFRSKQFPAFDYSYEVPAVFAQVEHDVGEDLTLAASARLDRHKVYGTKVSPRVSMLYRPGPWTVRASFGKGFYAPTPLIEEIEAAGFSRLAPLDRLKAETARSGSLDLGYAWGPFETSATVFASRVSNAIRLQDLEGDAGVKIINVAGETRTMGAEAMVRYRLGEFLVNGSYVFVDASEPEIGGGRRTVPLTPRHSGGLDFMWERPGVGRIGIEAYYTGRQSLDDNPYRTTSRPYVLFGVMGERVFGRARLFVNLENIGDVRVTNFHPLTLRTKSPEGGWTVDAWAPTEGFVANAGIRWRIGG